jgi:hypothetical protein
VIEDLKISAGIESLELIFFLIRRRSTKQLFFFVGGFIREFFCCCRVCFRNTKKKKMSEATNPRMLFNSTTLSSSQRPKPLPYFEQKVEISRLKERTQMFDQVVQKNQLSTNKLPRLLSNIQPRNQGVLDVTAYYPDKPSIASNGRIYKIQPLLNFPKPVREDKTRDVFGYRTSGFHKILSSDRDQFLKHRDDKRNHGVMDTRLEQGLKKPVTSSRFSKK